MVFLFFNNLLGFASLILVCVICSFWYFRTKRFYRLAAKIPGPPTVPVLGNILDLINHDSASLPLMILNLMDEYKGIARIWLGNQLFIYISRPEDIEICLNSNKLIEKNEVYSLFDDMLGHGLLNASGDVWKKHRRIITPTFHLSTLKYFIKIFHQNSQILAKRMETMGQETFDVFPLLRDCALNFITETALETNIDAQRHDIATSTAAIERMMQITSDRFLKIWLHSNQIFYLTNQGREYLQLRKIVQDTTIPLLLEKKAALAEEEKARKTEKDIGPVRKSFFRSLVNLNENSERFTDDEVRDEVMTIIVTGYETTAATIAYALVMLGIHQDVQSRLYQEVRTLELNLGCKCPEYDDLQTLHYMDMVIKETLRLYPVGPIIFRKATADVPLASCIVPKGASVAVVFLHSHRNPTIWKNPNKFDPHNFLPENSAHRHPYSYNPFSAGPRSCIGQKYAQISMRVMLYNILTRFKIHSDFNFEDVGVKIELTLKMINGFKIRLEPRACCYFVEIYIGMGNRRGSALVSYLHKVAI